MESKLNIYGLAGVPGRGRGRFMDGNGREQFGRPTSRKPIIKRRPNTRQVTRKLVKTTGGFKPAKVTSLRLDYGRINSQAEINRIVDSLFRRLDIDDQGYKGTSIGAGNRLIKRLVKRVKRRIAVEERIAVATNSKQKTGLVNYLNNNSTTSSTNSKLSQQKQALALKKATAKRIAAAEARVAADARLKAIAVAKNKAAAKVKAISAATIAKAKANRVKYAKERAIKRAKEAAEFRAFVAKGKAAAEAKNAKNRADLKALQAGIARAKEKRIADAKAKAKRIADARAKAAAIDELKRDTGGFKPSKPIIQTVVPDNVPMNLSTETTETEEKETFISKNKYAIGVAGLVTAGLLFFRKKDDKKKT
ncbi:hypothetical protein [Tenacibaculum finnmarkense]|uniref:hypothetical protein n=1 Tax=Tenacibaculum finnmarkense TaxID=2781243 RepID=UPI001EFB1F68|nr:hypothetical protein [Tenacibaculum finnmarkense]MCG8872133.1 hypothetical protein [Tenacibaculum finnmarkense]